MPKVIELQMPPRFMPGDTAVDDAGLKYDVMSRNGTWCALKPWPLWKYYVDPVRMACVRLHLWWKRCRRVGSGGR